MAAQFPNGTIFSLGTVLGTAVPVTAITNANPGVASATAHGFADGDILVMASGWTELDGRIVRVDGSVTNAFDLEGINTTSTQRFPAGGGAGSAREVSTWVPISQVTDSASSGGEQQFYQWVYLEDGRQRQRPTFKNARSLQLTLDYDPTLAWHSALLAADLAGDPYPLRAALPNGSFLYWNMYVGFDGEPTLNVNQNMQTVATFSFANPLSTRYGA